MFLNSCDGRIRLPVFQLLCVQKNLFLYMILNETCTVLPTFLNSVSECLVTCICSMWKHEENLCWQYWPVLHAGYSMHLLVIKCIAWIQFLCICIYFIIALLGKDVKITREPVGLFRRAWSELCDCFGRGRLKLLCSLSAKKNKQHFWLCLFCTLFGG